jgi:hypothetical protein
LLPAIFTSFYGYIEEFGTGGAAFRILVRDFFSEASPNLKDKDFRETMTAFEETISAWHDLAGEFKAISGKIKGVKIKEDRAALYKKAAEKAGVVYEKEKYLLEALKKIDTQKRD